MDVIATTIDRSLERSPMRDFEFLINTEINILLAVIRRERYRNEREMIIGIRFNVRWKRATIVGAVNFKIDEQTVFAGA